MSQSPAACERLRNALECQPLVPRLCLGTGRIAGSAGDVRGRASRNSVAWKPYPKVPSPLRPRQARKQRLEIADASVMQALTGQATQLAFRHVERSAMLGGVNEDDLTDILSGLFWRVRFVEGPIGERVQIDADQRDPLDAGVARIEEMGDF